MELPVSLPCSSGQRLGHRLGGTGFGDHHVQRGGTAAAVALVEVVDQVLVVGEGVDGLHVAVDHAEPVVDGLQDRGDGVGGAGRRGDDLVRVQDGAVVDAVHDVLQLALARSGEEDAGHALALQVLGQALGVAPAAGVVHHQRVLDAVGGVVDGGGVVRVDDLDLHAVGGDGVGFLVHPDGALERAVDRVAAQQAGALGRGPCPIRGGPRWRAGAGRGRRLSFRSGGGPAGGRCGQSRRAPRRCWCGHQRRACQRRRRVRCGGTPPELPRRLLP